MRDRHPIGRDFYAIVRGKSLVLYRTSDDTWAGETATTGQTGRELAELAGALDPSVRQGVML